MSQACSLRAHERPTPTDTRSCGMSRLPIGPGASFGKSRTCPLAHRRFRGNARRGTQGLPAQHRARSGRSQLGKRCLYPRPP